jgi:CRP-like cAMP-binding protein
MPNKLTQKLELFGVLPDEDRALLDEVAAQGHSVAARTDLIVAGDAPSDVHLVLEGFACRYKLMPDGRRHIFAFMLPGDFCDLNIFILKAMDHNIGTLTRCVIADIPRKRILEMVERPQLARALWWATLVDEATLREWLVNLGQRGAEQRIAHLLCEIHLRLQVIGLAGASSFKLPLSQEVIADTTGLSNVHANRMLVKLREEGLIEIEGRSIDLLDIKRIRAMCDFDPNYLHLDGGRATQASA